MANPTLEDAANLTEQFFSGPESLFAGEMDVSYVVSCVSTDAQLIGEEPEIIFSKFARVDFQEQVLYYEGFFEALEDEEWVTGLFTARWD